MHYYKRNLGDYAKKCGRLTMMQHGAYTLLIDACYDREVFPTLRDAIEWSWASSKEEIEAVEFVLSRFFTLENSVYTQPRIVSELSEYHSKADQNKRIAMERETKRAANRTNRAPVVNTPSPEQHEAPPNHKPLTKNQEPLTNSKEPEGTKSKSASPPFVLPDWIDSDSWTAFLEIRKAKKAKDTPFALGLIVKTLESIKASGLDPMVSLNNSIKSCWSDVYPPKSLAKPAATKHAGFSTMNYREGVNADGTFA